MLCADTRLDPAGEILACQQVIQVTGKLRQRKGVVLAADAPTEIAQETVIVVRGGQIVDGGDPPKTFGLKQLAEDVLERVQPAAKPLEDLRNGS